jgi:hypothetical protein
MLKYYGMVLRLPRLPKPGLNGFILRELGKHYPWQNKEEKCAYLLLG